MAGLSHFWGAKMGAFRYFAAAEKVDYGRLVATETADFGQFRAAGMANFGQFGGEQRAWCLRPLIDRNWLSQRP